MATFLFLKHPDTDQINQITILYRKVQWWSGESDDPDLVSRITSGSHCFLVALSDEKIIGMGRAISDGASDAYIQDVTVDDAYQGEKIGTQIVKLLVRRLLKDGLSWIGLIAERNSHRFYENLGFKVMADSTPLLLANDEFQKNHI
jgi:aralkylamine N-acetyltransferase